MKKIFFLLFVLSLGSGISFGYLEPKMFCQINKQNIKVSLNAADGSKCQDYVTYIEKTMRATAKNLIIIQWYIINRQDIAYRQGVKKQKLVEIDKLQVIRLNIITSMKAFEKNLLTKTVEYFLHRTLIYKARLQNTHVALATYSWSITPQLTEYRLLISRQLQTIDAIAQVRTIPELIPLMDTYVYLKQHLAWTSE